MAKRKPGSKPQPKGGEGVLKAVEKAARRIKKKVAQGKKMPQTVKAAGTTWSVETPQSLAAKGIFLD